MFDRLIHSWRRDGWKPTELKQWCVDPDPLGIPPRTARPDRPPFIPKQWASAKWHEAIFWVAILNLPFGPSLAFFAWLQGEGHAAAIVGTLGCLPSTIGLILAVHLKPKTDPLVDAAQRWDVVQAVTKSVAETVAESVANSTPVDGSNPNRSSPKKRRGWVSFTYQTSQGTEHTARFEIHAGDPPICVGDPITILVDPDETSRHHVLRRMDGVLLPGKQPL